MLHTCTLTDGGSENMLYLPLLWIVTTAGKNYVLERELCSRWSLSFGFLWTPSRPASSKHSPVDGMLG